MRLGGIAKVVNFEHSVAMVTQLHAESGSDDMLVAFLEQRRVMGNADTALPLIDKVSDPQRRAELLQKYQEFQEAADSIRSIHSPDPFAP